jgi:hypothetical protein
MARTVTTPFAGRARRLLVLVFLAAMTVTLVALPGPDARLAEAAPTPNGYALVEDVNTATFDRMVDFALIPGTTNEAVVVSQHEAKIRRVSLTSAVEKATLATQTMTAMILATQSRATWARTRFSRAAPMRGRRTSITTLFRTSLMFRR